MMTILIWAAISALILLTRFGIPSIGIWRPTEEATTNEANQLFRLLASLDNHFAGDAEGRKRKTSHDQENPSRPLTGGVALFLHP